MDDTKILKNCRICFSDSCYGYTAQSFRFPTRDLTEKEFKKWYKHICKSLPKFCDIDVYAFIDNEDGDCYDLTMDWVDLEMSKNPGLLFY